VLATVTTVRAQRGRRPAPAPHPLRWRSSPSRSRTVITACMPRLRWPGID